MPAIVVHAIFAIRLESKAFCQIKATKFSEIREIWEEELFRMIAEADAENTWRINYGQFKRVIAE